MIDDCSTDDTGDVARASRRDRDAARRVNTGSKAGAQNFALPLGRHAVRDGDRRRHDARARRHRDSSWPRSTTRRSRPRAASSAAARAHASGSAAATSSTCSRSPSTSRSRTSTSKPLISSGCFSMYRTDVLRTAGGWSDAHDGRGHGPHVDVLPARAQGALRARGGLLSRSSRTIRLHAQAAAALVARLRAERALHWRGCSRCPSCARRSAWRSGTRRWRRSPTSCCCRCSRSRSTRGSSSAT